MNINKKVFLYFLVLISFLLVGCNQIKGKFLGIVTATGFEVDGANLYMEVPNSTTTYSFIDQITVSYSATWAIYTDISATNKVASKIIELSEGDNIVYLLVERGEETKLYTVIIKRLQANEENDDTSEFALRRGVNVKTETKGFLKVWTHNQNDIPNIFSNYTTYIDFSDPENDFYNSDYANHIMKDQSGNGAIFYESSIDNQTYKYALSSEKGTALTYDLYFTSYTGSTETDMRDIYLDSILIQNAEESLEYGLANSIRIAFLDENNNIYGVYSNTIGDAFVTNADYNDGNGRPGDGNLSGRIVSSIDFGTVSFEDFEGNTYDKTVPENYYIVPAASNATVVRRIYAGTSIAQVDASQITGPLVKVVIWFEGSDPNTTDALIGQSVNISMIFSGRMHANKYSPIYNLNGGVNSNPKIIDVTEFNKGANSDAYLLTAPTKAGFTFAGWYRDAFYTDVLPIYNDDGVNKWELRLGTANPNNTFNLYARWD